MPQRPGPEGSGLSRPHVARASVTPAWSPGPAWGTPGRKWQLSTCSSAPETAARVMGPRAAVACDFSPGLRSVALTPAPLARPALPGPGGAGVPGGDPSDSGHVAQRSESRAGLATSGSRGDPGREGSWQGPASILGRVDSGVWTPPPALVPAGAVGAGSRAQAQSRLCGRRPWAAVTSQRLLLCVRNSPSFPEGPGVGPGQPAVCPWP